MGVENLKENMKKTQHHRGDSPIRQPPTISSDNRTRERLASLELSATILHARSLRDMNAAQPRLTLPETPISTKGWTADNLIALSEQFYLVQRVRANSASLSQEIEKFERSGVPLVVEGWQDHPHWPKSTFDIDWLASHGPQGAYFCFHILVQC